MNYSDSDIIDLLKAQHALTDNNCWFLGNTDVDEFVITREDIELKRQQLIDLESFLLDRPQWAIVSLQSGEPSQLIVYNAEKHLLNSMEVPYVWVQSITRPIIGRLRR